MFKIVIMLFFFFIFSFANEKVVLQLKWFHQFQFAGYYAAKEKGFYNEVGLDVQIKQRDIRFNNIKQVISNEAQYGIADSVLLLYKAKKQPVVIISPIFQHSPSVLISLKSTGLNSIYDFNDKDMIFYENDTDGFSILAMLKKLGIKPNIIRKRTKTDYLKLINKEVDLTPAYLSNEPFYFKEKNIDINIIDPSNYGFDLYGDILFTNEQEVKNNPQRVKKFREASLKGWEYALENKEEIIQLIHKKYNPNKSIEHLRFEAKAIERVISKETIPIGSIDRGRIKYISELYKEYGLSKNTFDTQGFIFDEYSSKGNRFDLSKKEIDYLSKKSSLSIPNMKTFTPFNFNQEGKALGYTIDYMKLLANNLGLDLNIITNKTWKDYLSMLDKGELDVIPHIAITQERKKFVNFTDIVHLEFDNSIAMKKNEDISSIKDLKNKIIAVQNKTFQHTFLEKNFPTLKLNLVKSTRAGLKAVVQNKADVFLGNLPSIEYYIQRDWLNGLKVAKINDWKLPDKTKLYMGVSKNNEVLKSILQKVNKNLPRKEVLKLKNKWLNVNLVQKSVLGLSNDELNYLNEKKELRMCIDPNWMPFEKLEDKKHIGITSDYMQIFRDKLNIPIKLIETKNWLETLDFAKKRKCDFITSASQTEERKKLFNFTKSLMDVPIVIATKINKPFVNTLLDVKDEKIAIVKGFGYISVLKKKYPKLDLVEVKSIKEGLDKVLDGEVYGIIGVLQSLVYNIQKDYFGHLKVDGKLDNSWSFPMATRKDQPELNSIFNKVISSISKETHSSIINKWISVRVEEKIDYTKLAWIVSIFIIITMIIVYKNRSIKEINEKMQEYITLVDENIITSSTNKDGNIISVSKAFCEISGYSRDELIGQNHRIIRHPDMEEKVFTNLWNTISNGKTWKGEIKNKKKNGGSYWVSASISPNFDKVGRIVGYTSIRQDISLRKKVEEISIKDELTTLYNKRFFNEMFEKEINRTKRDEGTFAFMIYDIDHFKQYNDNYGHQKGDEVLHKVGIAIKDFCKRSSDTPFRIGGEEFGVIFSPHFKENAIEFAVGLKNKIENLKIEHKYNSASDYITVSIGLYVQNGLKIQSPKEIYKLADDALYKAKEDGRNKVVLVEST